MVPSPFLPKIGRVSLKIGPIDVSIMNGENKPSVNARAENLIREILPRAERLNIEVWNTDNGATVLDFTEATLEGGVYLSRIIMGDLAEIKILPIKAEVDTASGSYALDVIEVSTNYPAIACMGSQYAGWNVKVKKVNEKGEKKTYFKCLGSGPARALKASEHEIFDKLNYKDTHDAAVLFLETRKKPDEGVAEYVASKCGVKPERVYLLFAPTASLAGSVQVAARIVETAIHKLTELGLDYSWLRYGTGTAPIAPVADDDFKAMGWTNDCIIFMGKVTLEMEVPAEDEKKLEEMVQKCPSSSSPSYGKPFLKVFEEAGGDFYKIDPGMFAPAEIKVINKTTGKKFEAGKIAPEILDFS